MSSTFLDECLSILEGPPATHSFARAKLLSAWTAHDLAHLLQVSRVMAKRYKQEAGPRTQFPSVME